MVTFQNLSRNISLVISQVAQNQNICKMINYTSDDPLSQPDIDGRTLVKNLILPYPFDIEAGGNDRTELRVFFPNGKLQGNQVIGDIKLFFDIVVSKKLWLISNATWSGVRAYEIAHYLTQQFQGKSIDTLGRLRFDEGFVHLGGNAQFDILRVIATMTTGK